MRIGRYIVHSLVSGHWLKVVSSIYTYGYVWWRGRSNKKTGCYKAWFQDIGCLPITNALGTRLAAIVCT